MNTQAAIFTDTFAGVPATEVRESAPAKKMNYEADCSTNGLRCVRGFVYAVLFEAVAALCIYGIWRLIA